MQSATTSPSGTCGVIVSGGNSTIVRAVGGGGSVGSNVTNQAIQLLGTVQQRPKNIQLIGTKQFANRQLITTAQRNHVGSGLKMASSISK